MARVSNRLDRINDLLKRELALLLQNELRDPRVGMVSVTEVKVSRDLAFADVFVTFMGKSSREEAEDNLEALNRASGFLRSLLARNINLRTTPRLKFIYDDSITRGQYLSGLIDEAIAQDKQHPSGDE